MKQLVYTILAMMLVAGVNFGQSGDTHFNVYFGNEKLNPNMQDCGKVYPVRRSVPRTKAVAAAALMELFKGVTEREKAQDYVSFEPSATKGILKSVKIKNGAAYVNFNKIVYQQLGNATTSCGGGFFFSSVEKTLLQFPTIKKVFYAVEGSPRDFYEWVQVGECPPELKNCSGKNF